MLILRTVAYVGQGLIQEKKKFWCFKPWRILYSEYKIFQKDGSEVRGQALDIYFPDVFSALVTQRSGATVISPTTTTADMASHPSPM